MYRSMHSIPPKSTVHQCLTMHTGPVVLTGVFDSQQTIVTPSEKEGRKEGVWGVHRALVAIATVRALAGLFAGLAMVLLLKVVVLNW